MVPGRDYLFLAGRGFELLRISDSGVSVAGLPLKMMRFGFSASVSTSSLAYVVTTFRFSAAVIPAYQDEKHIGNIARRTRDRLDHVLVVDDGSTDQTEQRAREAGAEVIVHAQNQGKGEAIKTGLAHWLGAANPSNSGQDRQITWVILLDSDGQHLPEEIDRFLVAAASVTRPTFFIGNRMDDVARMPLLRRVVNRYMSNEISRVCGQKIPDTQCGYRMLNRQLIPDMLGGGHRFDYDTEALIIACRKGYSIDSVPITTVYTDQVSKIHPLRDSLRFVKMMRRYKAVGS